MSDRTNYTGIKVHSRDGAKIGTATGGTRRCRMEGCWADRVYVRWPDGRVTYPCAKGMETLPNGDMKIL